MDIDIYVPHGVLVNSFVYASNLSKKLGNFGIIPDYDKEPLNSIHIRLIYPGGVKVLDIPARWESMVDKVNSP